MRCNINCPEHSRCDQVDTPMRCACYRVNTGNNRDAVKRRMSGTNARRVMRSDGIVYSSVNEAAGMNGVTAYSIMRACLDGYTPCGYGWRYLDEEEPRT